MLAVSTLLAKTAMAAIVAGAMLVGPLASGALASPGTAPLEAVQKVADGLVWLGQSGWRLPSELTGGPIVYLDPVSLGPKVAPELRADVILISHTHGDHFSPGDIAKISGDTTVVVGPPDAKVGGNFHSMAPGDTYQIDGITIEAVPAYNTDKAFHPRAQNWLGFIVTLPSGVRLYHAGDTDRVPEMKTFVADIAMLPVGGTYTMTVPQAADAVLDISPRIAIPMHYGSIVGKKTDGASLKAALDGKVEVVVKTVTR